jgi:hypothetical protein
LSILVNLYFETPRVVKRSFFCKADSESRHFRSSGAALAAFLMLIAGGAFSQLSAQGGANPAFDLLPEAMPDSAVTEVGREVTIEVLANDVGMPAAEQAPEIRVERVPPCATVQVAGHALTFRGTQECVGQDVVFGYAVKVRDDWLTAAVTVTVKPAGSAPVVVAPSSVPPTQDQTQVQTASCTSPVPDWPLAKIEGDTFNKSAAPSTIADFADLIEDATFSVAAFCITLAPIPADPVDHYFSGMNDDDRRNLFPELAGQTAAIGTGQTPANASETMVAAYSKWLGERTGRQLSLPTLQQYVAAAWELQTKHPTDPQTDAFLVLMRSGSLQWTSTPCGSEGSYWTIGPSIQAGSRGKLVKLCYNSSRMDRTGFRLVIK